MGVFLFICYDYSYSYFKLLILGNDNMVEILILVNKKIFLRIICKLKLWEFLFDDIS